MEANKVWFSEDKIFILSQDNEELWQSLLWYPRLKLASKLQRASFRLTPFGIRWDEIDEDVSFESFTYEDKEPSVDIARVFKSFPEINVSSVARRMGIRQSVMASYLCGAKKPSESKKAEIEEILHQLGKELLTVKLTS
jgi:hypothetical protein